MSLEQLVFLNQTHSIQGKVITKEDASTALPSFVNEGDYIITKVPRMGLGISTADCLPLIIYDPKNHAVAIAHAGWKGTVAGIGPVVLSRMKNLFSTKASDVEVILGPAAKQCCYEVQEDFMNNVKAFPYASTLFKRTDKGIFFDRDGLTRRQLEDVGVTSFNTQYHACTICDPGHCSVRRLPGSLERQMTVVTLR